MDQCIHHIASLFILDNEGNRIFSKYYIPAQQHGQSLTTGAVHDQQQQQSRKRSSSSSSPATSTHKYASIHTVEQQMKFEKQIFNKTHKLTPNMGEAEIIVVDQYLVEYMAEGGLLFYVVGPEDSNELVLCEVLQCLVDALNRLFENQVEKRTILENYSYLLLTIDEMLDDGIIMEIDPVKVAGKVEHVEAAAQVIKIAGEKVDLGQEGNALAAKLFQKAQSGFSGLTNQLFSF